MDRAALTVVAVVAAVFVAAAALVAYWNLGQTSIQTQTPINYTYTIVKTYPHDTSAFTEGLLISNGVMYESTGDYRASSLRQVNLETGEVQKEVLLPNKYFGEGLAAVNGSLVQLTWQSHLGFIYDKDTLRQVGNFSYSTEGWGLTYNGSVLAMSDGSSNLYFLDPVNHQRVGQISVHDGDKPVTNINELEYINGDIYANIWMQPKIAVINPRTGAVKGWINLNGIYQSTDPDSVLNGIAYDQQTGKLYVTGKNWPSLYEITIQPQK